MALQGFKRGWFVKYRGSWGEVEAVGGGIVRLAHWRGQWVITAPLDEITEAKTDQRRQWRQIAAVPPLPPPA